MNASVFFAPIKVLAVVILVLMLVATLYSGYMAIAHWTGIGV